MQLQLLVCAKLLGVNEPWCNRGERRVRVCEGESGGVRSRVRERGVVGVEELRRERVEKKVTVESWARNT